MQLEIETGIHTVRSRPFAIRGISEASKSVFLTEYSFFVRSRKGGTSRA